MSQFKKLDDLPKGKPHSYADVMKAMAELHKLVMKQSEAYGGKNSKLIRAQVTEESILKSFESLTLAEDDVVGELMDQAHAATEELSFHLKSSKDQTAMDLLEKILKCIRLALAENKK